MIRCISLDGDETSEWRKGRIDSRKAWFGVVGSGEGFQTII